MLKFEGFAIDVTEAEVTASKAQGPRLTSGEHELEILDAEYKAPVLADNTWLRFSLTLGLPGTKKADDGKFKGVTFHSVMVPTVNIRYKDKLGVFSMLQGFFDGLGESLTPTTVPTLIPAYFSDVSGLVGLKLKVILGYKKPYIDYVDKSFVIKKPDGSLYPTSTENRYPNRESAEGQAFTDSIEIQRFIEVIKVIPGEKQRADEKPKAAKRKASAEW